MAQAAVYGVHADEAYASAEQDIEIQPIMGGSDTAATRQRAKELDDDPAKQGGCSTAVVLRRVLLLLLAVGGFMAVFDVNFNVRFRWRGSGSASSKTSTTAGLSAASRSGLGEMTVTTGGGIAAPRPAPLTPQVQPVPQPQPLQPQQPQPQPQPPFPQPQPQPPFPQPQPLPQVEPPQAQQPPVSMAATGFFALGPSGSAACPPGGEPLGDALTCQAAARHFGKALALSGKTLRSTEPRVESMDPSGCVYREAEQDVYFNRHPGSAGREGRRPVCSSPTAPVVGFVMGEKGSRGCPEGTARIDDINVCQAAADHFGKSLTYKEPRKAETDPPGCIFRVPDQDVFFNSDEVGKVKEDRQPICSTPLLPPPSRQPRPAQTPIAPAPAAAADQQSDFVPAAALALGKANFVFGEEGTNSCPAGTFRIIDGDGCANAVQALNLKSMGGFENEVRGDPKGCIFRVPDQDVYFNSHPVGAANEGRRPICSKKAPAPAPAATPESQEKVETEAAGIKIFCFAWTPLRPYDETLLPEVRIQFNKCDGHAFFTDTGTTSSAASDEDVVKVVVPEQSTKRTSGGWLYHRNMVGVLPSLTHLLNSMDLTPYHWIVHTELDHFLSPARLRIAIAEYLRLLREGSGSERRNVDKAMMLMFGNAFLFNSKMIQELRRQWDHFGKAADSSSPANGCPEFMRGGIEWPLHCSQDIVYPALVDLSRPRIAAYGRSGCGQFDARNGRGKPMPAGCWEMQKNPWGQGEDGELRAIREFAKVQSMTRDEAMEHYKDTDQANNWELWYWAKKVPIIHHVGHPSVHKLARELLLP